MLFEVSTEKNSDDSMKIVTAIRQTQISISSSMHIAAEIEPAEMPTI